MVAPDRVLAFFTETYGGTTAARAIWQWAGGREAEVEFGEPADMWAQQWSKAAAADGSVRRLDLVREALYDQPGLLLLIEHLFGLGAAELPEAQADANLLIMQLDRLRRRGLAARNLRPILASSGSESWETLFVTLAPPLNEWLLGEERAEVVAACELIVAVEELVLGVVAVRDRVLAAEGAVDAEAEGLAVTAAVNQLKALHERALALVGPGDERLETLTKGLRRVVMRLEFRKKKTVKMAKTALISLLVSLNAHHEQRACHAALHAGQGLQAAVWATRALD